MQTARDLVTLPEDLGLMAAFTGSAGALARSAPDLTTAIAGAARRPTRPSSPTTPPRFPALAARPFPPTRALALALTDTFGRVAVETFAELADRYDVWLVAGVNMAQDWRVVCVSKATMPKLAGRRAVRRREPGARRALRDPDEPTRDYAYEATTPEAVDVALVFDPDGRLVSKQVKTYLTPIELPGPARPRARATVGRGLSAVRTPVGTLGFVTSKDAWMPDVTAAPRPARRRRARPAGVLRRRHGPPGRDPWAPDILARSGFADVLRHPSIEALVLPELTGNVFDFSADAQQHIVRKPRSARSAPRLALVGQPPSPGGRA